MVDKNPLTWFLQVNGMMLDIRHAPLGAQIAAFEQGLIPYIPALGPDMTKQITTLEEELDAPEPITPRRAKQAKHESGETRRCGLCGSTTKPLTKTPCCDNWICDDEDNYVMFSFAHNSCHRNHDRYTLCSYHFHEGHQGKWQECDKCRASFETEIYVYYGTNEYNFEKLENPPALEPTHCAECGAVIDLGYDGYSMSGDKYYCQRCSNRRMREILKND